MGNGHLVARALSGDREATSRICTLYAPRLRGYFVRRGLSRPEVEDAVQDTWARMLQAVAQRRIREESFEGWLFATARNVRADLLRRMYREPPRSDHELDSLAGRPTVHPHERNERIEQILEAIEDLPILLREPVILRHRHGLSYRRIAARLEISVNAVGVRLHRARRILQKRLQDEP